MKKIIIIVFTMLILVGCSTNDIVYQGDEATPKQKYNNVADNNAVKWDFPKPEILEANYFSEIEYDDIITDNVDYIFTLSSEGTWNREDPDAGVYMCVLEKDNTLRLYFSKRSVRTESIRKLFTSLIQEDYFSECFPFYECVFHRCVIDEETAQLLRELAEKSKKEIKVLSDEIDKSFGGISGGFYEGYACFIQITHDGMSYSAIYTLDEKETNKLASLVEYCFTFIDIKPVSYENGFWAFLDDGIVA